MRRVVAILILLSFASLLIPQSAVAADPRAVTSAQLHQAVQASHARAVAARQAVNNLLSRADIEKQMRHAGLVPDKVRAQVALLSDAEMLRLQQQVMGTSLQQARAGLSSGAIIGIICAGVGGSILLLWLALRTVDDPYYYYYY